MTLERASDLAFLGRLEEALIATREARSDHARWIRAYVANARGRFGTAERTLESIRSRSSDPEIRAKAAVTLGSVLRQTERHAQARQVETDALAHPPTPELRAHLLIGLAADAVGLGELARVDATLAEVGSRPAGGWRAAVRTRWVRCERHLLAGFPAAAAPHARKALEISRGAGARRHVAKSQLFLGVALLEGGRVREGRHSLGLARLSALRVGARPIVDVAERLLR